MSNSSPVTVLRAGSALIAALRVDETLLACFVCADMICSIMPYQDEEAEYVEVQLNCSDYHWF